MLYRSAEGPTRLQQEHKRLADDIGLLAADLSAKPRSGHCRHGSVRGPDHWFELLYGFVIVRIDRGDLVWINVTINPAAEWFARQITEAFPWNAAPGYMIRNRDRIYGAVVTRRLRAMGIRDKPIALASPWQNGFAERLIGSIRRECLDHIIISSEVHLRRIRISCAAYYNSTRTRLSLNKDAPISRAAEAAARILCLRSLTIDSVNSPLMDSRWLPALSALDFICVAVFQMQSADMSEV